MDAASWVLIIGAIGVVIVNVVTLVLTHLRAVRTEKTLARVEVVGNRTLKLTNSALLKIQRELAAEKWKTARQPDATQDDIRSAEAADRIVEEHEANQKELDDSEHKGDELGKH